VSKMLVPDGHVERVSEEAHFCFLAGGAYEIAFLFIVALLMRCGSVQWDRMHCVLVCVANTHTRFFYLLETAKPRKSGFWPQWSEAGVVLLYSLALC
jgi:hypothetical protein